jgi:hypothetical protein
VNLLVELELVLGHEALVALEAHEGSCGAVNLLQEDREKEGNDSLHEY